MCPQGKAWGEHCIPHSKQALKDLTIFEPVILGPLPTSPTTGVTTSHVSAWLTPVLPARMSSPEGRAGSFMRSTGAGRQWVLGQ